MKKIKKLLIGFILLWVLGFLVVWGITFFKKSPGKRFPFLDFKKEEAAPEEKTTEPAPQEPEAEAVPVRCYRISLTDFKDELPVLGTVKGSLEIELKFEISGVVESINFREGDVIYKGDLIASLDKKDADLKVDYAESKLSSTKTQLLAAEKKLQIFKNLYEVGGVVKIKLEEVELEVRSAGHQVETAKVELSSAQVEYKKTDLYAPRDGVLGSCDVEVGEFITTNDRTATLYETMKVFVELGIVEKDIDKIALEQDVSVAVDTYPGMSFEGMIDNIHPIIEGKSRTLTVKVGIENPEAMLLPGMFARALIIVAEFFDAIVVPSMSLNKTDEGIYKIFVLDEENNTVASRDVEVAYVTTDYTVIASGLFEGEVVVTDTPQELQDNMPVEIIEIQEASVEEEEENTEPAF